MVLEDLIGPLGAEKRPWEMLFLGIIYASVAIFLSIWIFDVYAGIVSIFLTTMATIPLIYHTMKFEEKKDLLFDDEKKLLKEHARALKFFMWLFFGITIAYVIWYVLLPQDIIKDFFITQTQTIRNINNEITAKLFKLELFTRIFLNNIKVLAFSVLFSFFYGFGAIFILTWNASVIAVAVGNFIRSNLSHSAAAGATTFAQYFKTITTGFLKYSIHGIPEILAYFVGGLAGGIVSVAVMRKEFVGQRYDRIILDVSDLILLAVLILFGAAVLEVYVTPLFF